MVGYESRCNAHTREGGCAALFHVFRQTMGRFAARRRAMLEAEGQRERQEVIEDAVKKLPKQSKPEGPRG